MIDDLRYRTTEAIATAIRHKEVSSLEVVDAFLAGIAADNNRIGALVTLDPEGARERAREADRATAGNVSWGPLHGVPFTVKDALETAGLRTTSGAEELAEHIPTNDAPVVARIRAAGGVLLGKSNTPRWALGPQTTNALFGTTANPWDPRRTAGGSSGGSAAAVASGFTAFDLGSDVGGSLRMPAAFCGVSAHKPSYGVTSQLGYLGHRGGGTTNTDMNVIGPIARVPGDLDLLLDVLCGPDPTSKHAWRLKLPSPRHRNLVACRVALWPDDDSCPVDDEVGEVVRHACEALTTGGARISHRRPELDFRASSELFRELLNAATTPALPDDLAEAATASHHRWLAMDRARAEIRDAWARFFTHHDALVCPVMPLPPFPHVPGRPMAALRFPVAGVRKPFLHCLDWVGLASLAYLPSTVVPVGISRSGTPVAVQVIGPFLEDRTALFVAAELARLVGPLPLATSL